MKILKFLAIITLLSMVAGCVSMGDAGISNQVAKINQEADQAWEADPLVQVLSGKIYRGEMAKMPVSFTLNNTKPTEEEKPAIARYIEHTVTTQNKYIALFANNPGPQNIFSSRKAAFMTLAGTLYAKEITYGEFHLKRQEIWAKYQEELEQKYAQERSLAQARYANFLRSQENIRASQPLTCTTYGNTTTCR